MNRIKEGTGIVRDINESDMCERHMVKGWITKRRCLLKIVTIAILIIGATTSVGMAVAALLRDYQQFTGQGEMVAAGEPSIHISSALANEIIVRDLLDDSGAATRYMVVPIECELSARYYTTNKRIVNATFPGESTVYGGDAINRFAQYGVANCRTELYVGYDLPSGYTIDIGVSGEAYIEHHTEENRFVVWRLWDIFADQTLAVTGESTGNEIISIYDENSNLVKHYELLFLPILHDEDQEFFDAWKKQILYGGSETLRLSIATSHSNYYDNRSY